MVRLAAEDSEDLTIISAQMQDALVRAADMRYLPKKHQFVLAANRFAWDAQPKKERRRAGLSINGVLSAQKLGFETVEPDTILSLLSLIFHPEQDGAGHVLLTFADGPSIRLKVECIDVQMGDMGEGWESRSMPRHDDDG
jgi:hypothetical protein